MLQRHFQGTCVKIDVGANRFAVASEFLEKYGYVKPADTSSSNNQKDSYLRDKMIGAVVLDDGMQHLEMMRDLDIVMVNGMMPWGNGRLLPRGSLREPVTSIRRADMIVIHSADMVPDVKLQSLACEIREHSLVPIFYSRLVPLQFFDVKKDDLLLPLTAVQDEAVLCISAVGFANAFVETVNKLGAAYVDRMEFSDHHFFGDMDIMMIEERIKELKGQSHIQPVVVTIEKDYDRDSVALRMLGVRTLVLCSSLDIIEKFDQSPQSFKNLRRCLVFRSYHCNLSA